MGENIVTKIISILLTGIVLDLFILIRGYMVLFQLVLLEYFKEQFIFSWKKITIPIIAHGGFDTIGFTMLFIG